MSKLPLRHRIWLPIGLTLVCGIAIGAASSLIVIKTADADSISSVPPGVPFGRTAAQITSDLRAKVNLNAEQTRTVEKIYETRLGAIQAIREDAMDRLAIEREGLRNDMRAALTAEQFSKWDERFQAMRAKAASASHADATTHAPTTLPGVDQVFDRFDANKDGRMTSDELPAASRERLMRADQDADGNVTREELTAARQRVEKR